MKKITFPPLFDWQKEVFNWFEIEGKTAVVLSPRQSGKSFLCLALLLKTAANKPKSVSIVVEPTLSQARKMFGDISKCLDGSGIVSKSNESLLIIRFSNGSEIYFKSAEQKDGLRGFTVSGILCLDECSFIDQATLDIILPTTTVHKASILICSTPLLKAGYFYKQFSRPDTNNKKSFDWANYDRSALITPEQIEEYRATYSPQRFQTEILGRFLDDNNGLFFKNITSCIGNASNADDLYIGIDCSAAVGGDYTALTVFNRQREMVAVYYNNEKLPGERIDWLANIINQYGSKVRKVLVESNSMGSTIIDLLKKKVKVTITPWVTTNKSKDTIITLLQNSLENKNITIVDDNELLTELSQFQANWNPTTGAVTYGRPDRKDDLVMSTALALYGLQKNYGTYNISV